MSGYVTGMARPRFSSPAWWFRSQDGRWAVAQPPNPAISVWIAAVLIGFLPLSPARATTVEGVRHGALIVWSLDEVVRGASPFRRVLGAVVLTGQLLLLARDW